MVKSEFLVAVLVNYINLAKIKILVKRFLRILLKYVTDDRFLLLCIKINLTIRIDFLFSSKTHQQFIRNIFLCKAFDAYDIDT